MFQNTMMAQDPVIRTAALLSLTSALMSLSFGCIYIVRFGTMRSMYKATRWAEVRGAWHCRSFTHAHSNPTGST